MRVLVCGGRDYDDRARVFETLDRLNVEKPIVAVIHGAATGADRLAHDWAGDRMIWRKGYRANWAKYGKAAGPRRNQWMLDNEQVEMVVAFPGGTGTADMVRRAKAAGIKVIEVEAKP